MRVPHSERLDSYPTSFSRIAELSVRKGQVTKHHQGVLQAVAGRPAGGDDRAGVQGVRQVRITNIFPKIFISYYFQTLQKMSNITKYFEILLNISYT